LAGLAGGKVKPPKRRQTLSQRWWANWGSRGRSPLAGGLGGCAPKIKKGQTANSGNPATSGTQNAGKPLAHEDGQWGSRGRSPLTGVVEDVPPASVAPREECKRERIAYIK